MELAQMIDHTFLKPDALKSEIQKVLEEACEYGFYSVCIPPMWVKYAADFLKESVVKVGTVIAFPLGANTSEVKAYEVRNAVQNGADEVDVVMNVGALKSGHYKKVLMDIQAVVQAAQKKAKVKVIVETCVLTQEEKIKACELAKRAKADFVKTSTGFASGGATVEDVALIRGVVGEEMGVKASGGIDTKEKALQMIEAGATRIGTSAGVNLI